MLRCRLVLESRRDWWRGREMCVDSALGPRKGTCARTGWQLGRANGNRMPNTLAHMGLGTVNPQLLLWRSWSAWRPKVLEARKHWMRCWTLIQCEPVIQIWPRTPTCLTPWIPWAHL